MRECVVCRLRYRGDIDHCPVDGGALEAVRAKTTEPAGTLPWDQEQEPTLPDIRPLVGEESQITTPMTGRALGPDGAYVLVDEGFELRTGRVHHAVFRGGASPTLRTLLRLRTPFNKIEGAVDPLVYAMVELQHVALPPFFESFPDDAGRVYLACGLLRGRPLSDRLEGDGMRVSEVLPVLSQVASLIATAHHREIVHGMLSPDDVWADPQLRVTVMGYGDLALTQRAMATLGAPAHRPRYRADGVDFWTRDADVVAFGGLAYELLMGSPPGNRDVDLGGLGPIVHRALGWDGPIPSADEVVAAVKDAARMAPVSRRVPTAIVEAPPDPGEDSAALTGEALKRALGYAGLKPLDPSKHPRGFEDLFAAFAAYYDERGRAQHMRYLECVRTRYLPVAQMKSRVPFFVAYSEALELHIRCLPDLLKTGVRDYVAYLIDDLLEIDDPGAQERARSLGRVAARLSV
ncbi:MAG: hypothetical protein AAGF12_08250 [Myxococcota bacterium]